VVRVSATLPRVALSRVRASAAPSRVGRILSASSRRSLVAGVLDVGGEATQEVAGATFSAFLLLPFELRSARD